MVTHSQVAINEDDPWLSIHETICAAVNVHPCSGIVLKDYNNIVCGENVIGPMICISIFDYMIAAFLIFKNHVISAHLSPGIYNVIAGRHMEFGMFWWLTF